MNLNNRFSSDVAKAGNGERGMGNREPRTGVWERVYSGNLPNSSKWWTSKNVTTGVGTHVVVRVVALKFKLKYISRERFTTVTAYRGFVTKTQLVETLFTRN